MWQRQRNLHTALAVVLALACPVRPAAAFNVYKVDPECGSGPVSTTIQEAVNAAAANPGTDYVWIANDNATRTYSGQHIVVNDADGVIIEGGFATCDDFDPGVEYTTVSGADNDGGPVFEVTGSSNVYFGNLIIEGAQRSADDSGGGISFVGQGEVDIAQTYVFLNHAGYGGGISVSASGGQAVVKLLHDATVYLNTAYHSGGGIRLEGNARLLVSDPKVAINGNTAAEYGGGVEILGPARADIGPGGGGFGNGVVAANYAANGGGIAVIDNGNGEAVLRVFADASHQPASIIANRATTNGGGIYLSGQADACLFAPRIKSNIAEDGAAIYYTAAGADSGSGIYFNDGSPTRLGVDCGPEAVADLGGSRDCNPGDDTCNAVIGNTTEHADDTPSAGATVFNLNGDTIAARIRMHDNTAAQIVKAYSAGTTHVYRCLVTDNLASAYVFDIAAGSILDIRACTISSNSIGADYVINLNYSGAVYLGYEIIDQPGKHTALWQADPMYSHFFAGPMLTNDAFGLNTANSKDIIVGTPIFVDATQRDYHLAPVPQVALDFGYLDAKSDFFISDLDGNAFPPVDLPGIPNFIGFTSTADLGAYERQFLCAADEIFCNGFDL